MYGNYYDEYEDEYAGTYAHDVEGYSDDDEMKSVYASYKIERDDVHPDA